MTTRLRAERASLVDRIVTRLVDPSKRISVLILIAYASGISGVVLSVFGDAADPTAPYSAIGIGLMGISFVSLFVVSAVILDLGNERAE